MNMRLKLRLKLRIIPKVGDSRKAVCGFGSNPKIRSAYARQEKFSYFVVHRLEAASDGGLFRFFAGTCKGPQFGAASSSIFISTGSPS
jgi:hypothetical protein